MNAMNENFNDKIKNQQMLNAIDCLAVLFWDYNIEDVKYLRQSSDNIDYIWATYVEHAVDTHSALWKAWINKFSSESKCILVDYAVKRLVGIAVQQGE